MKHLTGLAHIALYTRNLEESLRFYRLLGGEETDRADVPKTTGTNHIAMVRFPGFFLEIIEPHDGAEVTAAGGLFPHIAIETEDVDAAVRELRDAGIRDFASETPADMPIFGGIRNIFFFGPSGEKIELLQHTGRK